MPHEIDYSLRPAGYMDNPDLCQENLRMMHDMGSEIYKPPGPIRHRSLPEELHTHHLRRRVFMESHGFRPAGGYPETADEIADWIRGPQAEQIPSPTEEPEMYKAIQQEATKLYDRYPNDTEPCNLSDRRWIDAHQGNSAVQNILDMIEKCRAKIKTRSDLVIHESNFIEAVVVGITDPFLLRSVVSKNNNDATNTAELSVRKSIEEYANRKIAYIRKCESHTRTCLEAERSKKIAELGFWSIRNKTEAINKEFDEEVRYIKVLVDKIISEAKDLLNLVKRFDFSTPAPYRELLTHFENICKDTFEKNPWLEWVYGNSDYKQIVDAAKTTNSSMVVSQSRSPVILKIYREYFPDCVSQEAFATALAVFPVTYNQRYIAFIDSFTGEAGPTLDDLPPYTNKPENGPFPPGLPSPTAPSHGNISKTVLDIEGQVTVVPRERAAGPAAKPIYSRDKR